LNQEVGDDAAIWSTDLNINPAIVDTTHQGAIVIDINIESSINARDVRCVKVISRSVDGVYPDGAGVATHKAYYPETVAVYWGANSVSTGSHSFGDFLLVNGAIADEYSTHAEHVAPLNIGMPEPAYGDEHSTEVVAGLLYCAQLAVTRYDEGVNFWRFAVSSNECTLFERLSHADGCHDPGVDFISGDVGNRVSSFHPIEVDSGLPFSLTLFGEFVREGPYSGHVWLPSQQRIKLVDITDGETSCTVADSEYVKGIRCRKGKICSNAPSDSSDTSLTFSDIMVTSPGDRTFMVCYNPGTTWDALHWAPVVDSSGETLQFNVTGTYSWESAGTSVVQGSIISLTVDADINLLKVVTKDSLCSASMAAGFVVTGTSPVFGFNTGNLPALGTYRVCAKTGVDDWFAISHEDGPDLEVLAQAGHIGGTAGFFPHQQFSGVAGDVVITEIKGRDLSGECTASGGTKLCVGPASTASTNGCIDVTCADLDQSVSFSYDTDGQLNADDHDWYACFGATGCTPEKVGTLTLTSAVQVGHRFVLSPGEVSALEIHGSGIDPVVNRIMIVGHDSTCGTGAASGAAVIHYEDGTQDGFNHWRPLYSTRDAPMNNQEYGYVSPPDDLGYTFHEYEDIACDFSQMTKLSTEYDRFLCSRCTDDNPSCRGFLGIAVDSDSSMAYCMSDEDARRASAAHAGIKSHITKTGEQRHYFYAGCETEAHRQASASDGEYNLYVKNVTHVDPTTVPVQAAVGGWVDENDSWSKIGRWAGLSFADGGDYRVCWCSGANECQTRADYKVQVGEIHVSGVSCLLQYADYQAHCCRQTTVMDHGGYSCWPSTTCEPLPTRTIPVEKVIHVVEDPDAIA